MLSIRYFIFRVEMCRYWRSSLPLINSFSVIYKIILSVSKNAPAVDALFFCFIKDTADYICAFLFLGLIQMGIDVCRCGQVGVPEEGRYIQQRHILIDEDAGEGEDPDAEKENPDEPDAEEKLAQADAVYQRVTSLQNELAEAAQAYYQALDEHEAAVSAVDDAQRRIDEASTQIDTLQDRLAKRAVGMYKAGKFTVIDLLMGSASFKEFATGLDMYDALNENDERMIEETKAR